MHGIVLTRLRAFVGSSEWDAVLSDAALPGRVHVADERYPDTELPAIVRAAAARTGVAEDDLVEAFGRALAPDLLAGHGSLIDPAWGILDILEHVDEHIHAAIRRDDERATPPRVRALRIAPNEVRVRYASRRGLCRLARGIIDGVATVKGERVAVTELSCTHAGDATCEFVVRLVGRSAQVPGSAHPESGALVVGSAVQDA